MDSPHDSGGEVTCYAQYLDDDGSLLEPAHLIRLHTLTSSIDGQHVYVGEDSDEGKGRYHSVRELGPLPREGIDDYRARLDLPPCRTEAWRIVLLTEQQPVVVHVTEGQEAYGDVLLAYLKALLE